MSQSLLISLLGTSKERPLRVIRNKKPDLVCLVGSTQTYWKEATIALSEEIKKELLHMMNEDKIWIKESVLIDFDSVFSLLYGIIKNFKETTRGKNPVYIDVSATTGVALSASILVSSIFDDVHVHYVHAIFKPIHIQNILQEENRQKKQIRLQPILEIPRLNVPIKKIEPKSYYHDILLILKNELNEKARSQNEIINHLQFRDNQGNFVLDEEDNYKPIPKTTSNRTKFGRYITKLSDWGMVTRRKEIGYANEIVLTDFGKSILNALEKLSDQS